MATNLRLNVVTSHGGAAALRWQLYGCYTKGTAVTVLTRDYMHVYMRTHYMYAHETQILIKMVYETTPTLS